MRRRFLIAGVPATGKTTVGRHLGERGDFLHFDLEERAPGWNELLRVNPASLIDDFLSHEKDVVVTWGFPPEENAIRIVELFKDKGFKVVWFDGDHASARREFLRREGGAARAFREQIDGIRRARVVERIGPLVVNTFDAAGRFKELPRILSEMLGERPADNA